MLLSLSLDLLILDEPTANLDVKTKEEFIEIIKLLNSKGVTILITSHIIEELQQIINHLVIINNKKIVYDQKFDKNKQTIKAIYDQFVERKMQDLNKIKDIISF
ncbi:AAA family ATPase [Spiroplasma sp. AdecLV25b]|uniref:AAA family ATPase n=1 Tax=Spiroplasma sp. AdecLV25b TaxID=3027162 RepID=UPI0027DF400A|nr:AAA family ATPase [Spiroplasma sp. AdecLV25b]